MENNMQVIEARDLSKSFTRLSEEGKGKKRKVTETFYAVDGISLQVAPGEIVGILGPNGAGKTTLLRMLGGIMNSESGSILVEGTSLGVQSHLTKGKFAYLSNNTKLYGRFSALELFLNFGYLYGLSKEEILERVTFLEERLELKEFLHNRIDTLSTGQTQRVNIARCLIHDPILYILDEPTLGLDVISSKSIVEFMKSEKERGKAVIYSTHYMEEAEYLCDRILLLHKGHILAEGKVEELKEKYQVPSIRDLFFRLAEESHMDTEEWR
ncbi:MAG: ABC transporter ATP-binding protein [Eubacteriales bacterium]